MCEAPGTRSPRNYEGLIMKELEGFIEVNSEDMLAAAKKALPILEESLQEVRDEIRSFRETVKNDKRKQMNSRVFASWRKPWSDEKLNAIAETACWNFSKFNVLTENITRGKAVIKQVDDLIIVCSKLRTTDKVHVPLSLARLIYNKLV